MPGDVDWTKANVFQGKRKVDCQWDEVEYETVHQVADGLPSYETTDLSGKEKVPHRIRPFRVAIPQGLSTALFQSIYANINPITHVLPLRNSLLLSVTMICQEIPWKSDFPDAQPIVVRWDRWMTYNDHS